MQPIHPSLTLLYSMPTHPPRPTIFPYTTLFQSRRLRRAGGTAGRRTGGRGRQFGEIGRAHVLTSVSVRSRMLSFSCKRKKWVDKFFLGIGISVFFSLSVVLIF